MSNESPLHDLEKSLRRTELFDHLDIQDSDLRYENGFIGIEYSIRGKSGNEERVNNLWNSLEKYITRNYSGAFSLMNDDGYVLIQRKPIEGIPLSINVLFPEDLCQYIREYTQVFKN